MYRRVDRALLRQTTFRFFLASFHTLMLVYNFFSHHHCFFRLELSELRISIVASAYFNKKKLTPIFFFAIGFFFSSSFLFRVANTSTFFLPAGTTFLMGTDNVWVSERVGIQGYSTARFRIMGFLGSPSSPAQWTVSYDVDMDSWLGRCQINGYTQDPSYPANIYTWSTVLCFLMTHDEIFLFWVFSRTP